MKSARTQFKVHPVANLFPEMAAKEFDELKNSIRRHGQLQPIVVDGDQLLDGRHRLRACVELGVEPVVVQFSDLGLETSPATWIFSTNARRRNLTDDQKLAVLSDYNSWVRNGGAKSTRPAEHRADDTQPQAGTTYSDESAAAEEFAGRNRPEKSPVKRPRGRPAGSGNGRQREQVAKAADQSEYRARRMLKLHRESPELAAAVVEGRISLKDAMRRLKASQPTSGPGGKPEWIGAVYRRLEKQIHAALERRTEAEQVVLAEKLLFILIGYLPKAKRDYLSGFFGPPEADASASLTVPNSPSSEP